MGETIEMINKHSKGDAIMVSDVGQHQMFACRYAKFNDKSNVTSGGLGTMDLLYLLQLVPKWECQIVKLLLLEMEVSNDHSRIRNYFPNQSSVKIVVLNNEF
jgi:acetolactate synthase-1/2/3 large subunit